MRSILVTLILIAAQTQVVLAETAVSAAEMLTPPVFPVLLVYEVCPNTHAIISDDLSQEGISYQWYPATYLSDPNIASPVFTRDNLSDTIETYNYIVNRATSEGTIVDTVIVKVKPHFLITSNIQDYTLCQGDSVLISLTGAQIYDFFPYEQVYIVSQTGYYLSPDSLVYYSITGYDEFQCPSWPITVEVRVDERPDSLYFGELQPGYCILDSTILLPEAYPPDAGYWTGPGVTQDSLFSPLLAGAGIHTISYNIADIFCTFSFSRTFEVFPTPDIMWEEIPNLCPLDPMVALTASPVGGTYSGPGINALFFDPSLLGPGSYELTYMVNNGFACRDTESQVVTIKQLPPKPEISGNTTFCNGTGTDLTSSPFTNYLWNTGATQRTISVDSSGIYWVTINSVNGCSNADTVTVSELDPVSLTLDSPVYPNGFNISTHNGNDGTIDLSVTAGVAPLVFQWSNGSSSEDPDSLEAGNYTVTVIDSAGCIANGAIVLSEPDTVIVVDPPDTDTLATELRFPNSFTPNGDGFNDIYQIKNLLPSYRENTLRIWDLTRQLVFSSKNYPNTWQGTDQDGTRLLPGTYFGVFTSPELEKPVRFFVELRYE